jgi:hypothetical protein
MCSRVVALNNLSLNIHIKNKLPLQLSIYCTFVAYVCLSCVQCLNYIQLLWQEIIDENKQDSNTELYNGAVESLYTLIGRYVS